jgi:hypothetical protein
MRYWLSPHLDSGDDRGPDFISRLLGLGLDPSLWWRQALRGAA